MLDILPQNTYIILTACFQLYFEAMYTIGATGAVSGSEVLLMLSIVESVILLLICYWQFLFASEDFQPFTPAARVLPIALENMHQWFARRLGMAKLSLLAGGFRQRYFLPPARSADFLLLRDGWFTAGIFATPARHDIPPPLPIR